MSASPAGEPETGAPDAAPGGTVCRFCAEPLALTVVDLGMSPLCQTVIRPAELEAPETFYPLHVRVCERCWLVQIPEVVAPAEIFREYAYFSSFSSSWVEHARRYASAMVERARLDETTLVIEVASNDGYLLSHFRPWNIPVLGIDPAENVAAAALEKGVPTIAEFFDLPLAERLRGEGREARLLVGNNVLAQVPDINGFVAGIKTILARDGIATFEVPHLRHLLARGEYDTIYHEHFSYFSLSTLRTIFGEHGLALVDVEELPSHGGSIRAFFEHADASSSPSAAVDRVIADERTLGLLSPEAYMGFTDRVATSKRRLLDVLFDARDRGEHVAGYGAPGKGNTLLNYCGIRTDLLAYTVDRNPYKQGCYTPGTRIPIHAPDRLDETRPDVIMILPWNLAEEISSDLARASAWGTRLLVPIPAPTFFAPGAVPGATP